MFEATKSPLRHVTISKALLLAVVAMGLWIFDSAPPVGAENKKQTLPYATELDGDDFTMLFYKNVLASQTIDRTKFYFAFGWGERMYATSAEVDTDVTNGIEGTLPRVLCNVPKPWISWRGHTVLSSQGSPQADGWHFIGPNNGGPIHRLTWSDTDHCEPRLEKAVASTTGIQLQYSEALSGTNTPHVNSYTVTYDGAEVMVSRSGHFQAKNITLVFDTPLTSDTGTFLVTYTPPATGAIQDAAGNKAAGFTDQAASTSGVVGPPTQLKVRDAFLHTGYDTYFTVRGDRPTTLASNDKLMCEMLVYQVDGDDITVKMDGSHEVLATRTGNANDLHGGNIFANCKAIHVPYLNTANEPVDFIEWRMRIYDASEDLYSAWTPVTRLGTRPATTMMQRVAEPEPEEPEPFAVSWELPDSHDGTSFTFGVSFSAQPQQLTASDMTAAINVENGSILATAQSTDGLSWDIVIEPDDNNPVRVDFSSSGISSADGSETLYDAMSAWVDYRAPTQGPTPTPTPAPTPEPTPTAQEQQAAGPSFTASWNPPTTHDGAEAVTFRMSFSEQPASFSYRYLKFTAVQATNGIVQKTKRVRDVGLPNQYWDIVIQPDGTDDMIVTFNGPEIVAADDGEQLTNSLSTRIAGPTAGGD